MSAMRFVGFLASAVASVASAEASAKWVDAIPKIDREGGDQFDNWMTF